MSVLELNKSGQVKIGVGSKSEWIALTRLPITELQQAVFITECYTRHSYLGLISSYDSMLEYLLKQGPLIVPLQTKLRVIGAENLCQSTEKSVNETTKRLNSCTEDANQIFSCLVTEYDHVNQYESQLRACDYNQGNKGHGRGLTTSTGTGKQSTARHKLLKQFDVSAKKMLRVEAENKRCSGMVCKAHFERQQAIRQMNHVWEKVLPRANNNKQFSDLSF